MIKENTTEGQPGHGMALMATHFCVVYRLLFFIWCDFIMALANPSCMPNLKSLASNVSEINKFVFKNWVKPKWGNPLF